MSRVACLSVLFCFVSLSARGSEIDQSELLNYLSQFGAVTSGVSFPVVGLNPNRDGFLSSTSIDERVAPFFSRLKVESIDVTGPSVSVSFWQGKEKVSAIDAFVESIEVLESNSERQKLSTEEIAPQESNVLTFTGRSRRDISRPQPSQFVRIKILLGESGGLVTPWFSSHRKHVLVADYDVENELVYMNITHTITTAYTFNPLMSSSVQIRTRFASSPNSIKTLNDCTVHLMAQYQEQK